MIITNRYLFLAGAALALPLVAATPAFAADADGAATTPDAEIVVTGTRAQNRTKLDTVAPVDVLTADALTRQGTTELGAAIANVAPSIDFPRSAGTDGTDSIRPATLRGLSPDQTLVLINGVRGHASAWSTSMARWGVVRPRLTSTPFPRWRSARSKCCAMVLRRNMAPTRLPAW
jgi:iron complex outermembrane receptor protein